MRFLALAASLIALAGCNWRTDPPSEAPTGVTSTPGDGLVLVSWNPLADLTYWIFFAPGGSVSATVPGSSVIRNAVSPRVVGGLTNLTQYAFVMNATHNSSAAGPNSPIVVATPRLAGGSWVTGLPLTTTQNLKGIAFNGSRFVLVGDAATILAGDFNYANSSPPGVTAWMPPTSLPAGFAANLAAVIFSGGFLALGADGSTINSGDGLTWIAGSPVTTVSGTVLNALALGVVAGTSTFIAVGNNGAIFTSSDTLTWTPITPITPNNLFDVSFLNGGFVATGAAGTLLTSPDGRAWTRQTSRIGNALRAAAFANTVIGPRYVVVGDLGTIVTSADGITWSAMTLPTPPNLLGVTNGGATGARFVAVGSGGVAAYSDDAASWTLTSAGSSNLARVVFAQALYLAVGVGGANWISR